MSKDIMREFYNYCKEMDIQDTLELELNAQDDEERDFISLISNFILQQRQRKVIAQKRF